MALTGGWVCPGVCPEGWVGMSKGGEYVQEVCPEGVTPTI